MANDMFFDNGSELEDLRASDMRIIINPELKKRRMGATQEDLSEISDRLAKMQHIVSPDSGPPPEEQRTTSILLDDKTPIQRFRALANTVKNNLKWAKLLEVQDDPNSFTVHQGDDDNTLTFDVNAFRSNVQTMGTLPLLAKRIMTKNSWERTPEEINYLFGFVDRLKCFDRYSTNIKHELAGVIFYDNFEAGRVLVRQGHPGLAFYFILKGTVIVEVSELDKRTGNTNTRQMGEHYAGSSFGELALLHGTKRGATIRCKEDSEFLRLDKPDFDMVLRRSYEQEWNARMHNLQLLDVFADWTDEEMKATTDRSKVIVYQPNSVILSDITEEPDDIYFIKSGEVKVVREVVLIENKLPFGRVRLTPPPDMVDRDVSPDFKPEKSQRVVRKLLHIATVGKGAFFGVGEDLRKTHLIAINKVECILVARVCFMRHKRGKSLIPMKEQVEELFPSYDETFASYLVDKRWRTYKRNIVKELAGRHNIPNNTTIEDVPFILRQENSISSYYHSQS